MTWRSKGPRDNTLAGARATCIFAGWIDPVTLKLTPEGMAASEDMMSTIRRETVALRAVQEEQHRQMVARSRPCVRWSTSR